MHNNQTPQRPSHNQNQQFNRPPIRETPMYQYPKQQNNFPSQPH
jgi:hypothetical protein